MEIAWKMNQPWSSTYVEKQKAEAEASSIIEKKRVELQPGDPNDTNGWVTIERPPGTRLKCKTFDPELSIWFKTDNNKPVLLKKGKNLWTDGVRFFHYKSAETYPIGMEYTLTRQ